MPRALPAVISVTCDGEWPPERSRCGSLARRLPVLAPALCRLTLTCGLRCAIHDAIRACRPTLNRLAAFDLTVITQHQGCAQPPALLDSLGNALEELRPGPVNDREFRFASLPETVTDLRVAIDSDSHLGRLGSIVVQFPRLVRLALPCGNIRLFRDVGPDGRNDADDDSYYSSDDSGDEDDGMLAAREARLRRPCQNQLLPMSSLTHLSVHQIDRAIRSGAFPNLHTLTVATDAWTDALTQILLNVPQLVELRLGVFADRRDGYRLADGTDYPSATVSDIHQDVADENDAPSPYRDWAPAIVVAKANAEIDADPPRRDLPRTIRRVTLSRLSSNRVMRRLARRLALDVEQLRVVNGDGVGDLTPFAAHRIARLELPEHAHRMLRLFPAAFLTAGVSVHSPSTDAFHSGAIERVERLVLTCMPSAAPPVPPKVRPHDDAAVDDAKEGGRPKVVRQDGMSTAMPPSSPPPIPLGYARPHCLQLDLDFDACGDCTRKSTMTRFRTLAERYSDVRHLVLPRANIGPDGVFASVIGDVLMCFKRLVIVDISRLHLSAPPPPPPPPRGQSAARDATSSTPSSSTSDAAAARVADILRSCLYPEQLGLLRFSGCCASRQPKSPLPPSAATAEQTTRNFLLRLLLIRRPMRFFFARVHCDGTPPRICPRH